ncbi:MAG: LAGLIDADG family homing endonuclease [Nitrososphaera sp.]
MEVKDTNYAWLAGIIDGEGSIFISKTRVPENIRGFQYRAQMSITNTDEELIMQVNKIANVGSIFRCRERRKEWKDRFIFSLNASGMRELLPRVIPYLVLKKRIAIKTIEFLSYMRAGKRGEYPQRVYELYEEIKFLNQKGKQARLIVQVQD